MKSQGKARREMHAIHHHKDLVEHIISILDSHKFILLVISRVCKLWYQATKSEDLWYCLLWKNFGVKRGQALRLSAKAIYKNCVINRTHIDVVTGLMADHLASVGYGRRKDPLGLDKPKIKSEWTMAKGRRRAKKEEGEREEEYALGEDKEEDKKTTKWGIGGSLAADFYGLRRIIHDIDFLICTGDAHLCGRTEALIEKKGFVNIGNCNSQLTDYGHNWCFHPTNTRVDLCATGGSTFLSRWKFDTDSFVYSPERRLWFVTLPCLITMKIDTHRPKDINDIKQLVVLHRLDTSFIPKLQNKFTKRRFLDILEEIYPKNANVFTLEREILKDQKEEQHLDEYGSEDENDRDIEAFHQMGGEREDRREGKDSRGKGQQREAAVREDEYDKEDLALFSRKIKQYQFEKAAYTGMEDICTCSRCMETRLYG